jgi:hypothetical protein
MQSSFLNVVCNRTKPPPATADATCIAIDDNTGKRYLCKSGDEHPMIPPSEWICAALARSIHIPVADSAVIQAPGYSGPLFGSIWEGGGQKDSLEAIPKVSNTEIFSDAFAFDLAVHNVDRHPCNFLYLELAGDIVAKLIDASKAFIYHSIPLPLLPLDPDCATIANLKYYRRHHPYQKKRAVLMANRVLNLSDEWMSYTLQGMPQEWLYGPEIAELDRWWRNDRARRIASVIQEL